MTMLELTPNQAVELKKFIHNQLFYTWIERKKYTNYYDGLTDEQGMRSVNPYMYDLLRDLK